MIIQYYAPFSNELQLVLDYTKRFANELPDLTTKGEILNFRQRIEKTYSTIQDEGLQIQLVGLINFEMGEFYRHESQEKSELMKKLFSGEPFYQEFWLKPEQPKTIKVNGERAIHDRL